MRANIHAQISLALNRIYTEWYPSKGYSYNITNSTSYDQYFVYNRTVFEVMQRITDDIFNTYVKRGSGAEPYYTEYCDGKSVSCAGMKQWGTVDLANQGLSALQILRYYYGSNISIVSTDNIAAIYESYPGSSLRLGDSGTNVSILQRQLNRIAQDYPSFGTLAVDGVFGSAMETTVKKFQRQFSLTADGIVGRSTWYKISYIYASVKDLAELTSEGEVSTGGSASGGSWGGTVLRIGSSGTAVEQVQFWLNTLSQFNTAIPGVSVDGVYGAATAAAVRDFQQAYALVPDGVVGETTWSTLYNAYLAAEQDINNNAYPGTPLRQGSEGANVKLVQFWLRLAANHYSALDPVSVDGLFGASTRRAVVSFQDYFGLTADGIVGEATWNKLHSVYIGIANGLLSPDLRPGEYPGVLRQGSTGTAVRELQFYLHLLATYYSSLTPVEIDGSFGAVTTQAVRDWQRMNSLTVDGVVGRATWDSIYAQASRLRQVNAASRLGRVDYPGVALTLGASGEAVTYLTRLLEGVAFWMPPVQSFGVTDQYSRDTAISVSSFQRAVGLSETGVADQITWDTLEMVYVSFFDEE